MNMQSVIKFFALATFLSLSLNLSARDSAARSGQTGKGIDQSWSYSGETAPEKWSTLSSTFSACGAGQAQSPVDIQGTIESEHLPLSFFYRTSILSIRRSSHGISLDMESGGFMKMDGERFQLRSIDLHIPGEHTYLGRAADMEIQLNHIDSNGDPVILAIPVNAGRRNNLMVKRIARHLPQENGGRRYSRQIGINAIFLLPTNRSHVLYNGSLTTPPCKESARWIVFKNPIEIPKQLLRKFIDAIGYNARPVQPLNGRMIWTSIH
ncbi:carbonate dehydratase [bacterium endosymbiont of Escarpia laminata]|nr:MAG: carbonate dehydratase [bacterium endosymbiont of Escarpia laminata]